MSNITAKEVEEKFKKLSWTEGWSNLDFYRVGYGQGFSDTDQSFMMNLLDWIHNSAKGDTLEIVKITDMKNTVLGLKDSKSSEVFILGHLHDLTFTLAKEK